MKTPLVSAIIGAIVSVSCGATLRPMPPAMTPSGVRFILMNRDARSVALAGSFNQWSTSTNPLARDGSRGVWTVVVALPPGEHLFMYIVDGARWISPPLADFYMDDGFGSKNGVVVVHPKER
jgi:1,4-alpha-glucan branching enzyme